MQKKKKKFDAEGSGYDYESARKYGMKPDAYGKWESRVPETGLLLKGAKHDTWKLTLEDEKKMGCKIVKKAGRYYSICPDDSSKKK